MTVQYPAVFNSESGEWTSLSTPGGLVFIQGYSFKMTATLSFDNGVFNENFEHYLIILQGEGNNSSYDLRLRYKSNGILDESANYSSNLFTVNGSSLFGSRETGQTYSRVGTMDFNTFTASHINIYSPNRSGKTLHKSSTVSVKNGGYLEEFAGSYNNFKSFDSVSIYVQTSPIGFGQGINGKVALYGYTPNIPGLPGEISL
jgi:hypothetical protein